ncbi:CYFA0S01e11122g1_1 [Cyberlindnera fabianii]|uniref:CYFA0S01e11122g1_1 n=1 Tax=Cyberlindnera fabianii TaxID=36022 RepID=A0A061AQ86_CYBFA|nr:General amino acid permease AGP1 [Cyberlindnera fabianii]CDR37487.1 CYFA0S01e11122g1_1 [Cyberlindnera fabianii]
MSSGSELQDLSSSHSTPSEKSNANSKASTTVTVKETCNYTSTASTSVKKESASVSTTESTSEGWWANYKDGFSRALENDAENQIEETKGVIDNRRLIMITIGSGLGTGLLVGNGRALALGGPAGLLIGYLLVGVMLFFTMFNAGELAVAYPNLEGGFSGYGDRLSDPSFNFAVSWIYLINWLSVLPLEMVTACITIQYWTTSVNPCIFVTIFLVFIYASNFYGASGYAEAEFWMNLAKVLMLIGFIIVGIIVDCGGNSTSEYIGFRYFKDPGAFSHGFKGVCAVFVTSAFSLGGTEFMATTAADQEHPKKSIPKAMKHVGYRLIIFYFLSIFIVGLIVPYDSQSLMGSGKGSGTSPYVIGVMQLHKALAHVVNAVILIALLSVGNAAMYSSARTLLALAKQGAAPQYFNYVDKRGRPLRALILAAIIGLFSYIVAYPHQDVIFTWLLSISGVAALFAWAIINVCQIRLRAALKAQNKQENELGYKSPVGLWGSYIALIIIVLILIAQFWISLFPIGSSGPSATEFFKNDAGLIVVFFIYIVHKLFTKNWKLLVPASEIDLVSDRRVFSPEEHAADAARDAEERAQRNWLQATINFLF